MLKEKLLGTLSLSRYYSTFISSKLHTTCHQGMFFEPYRKGGKDYEKPIKHSPATVKQGLKQLRSEFKKWKQEVSEHFLCDPLIVCPGDSFKLWAFDSKESLENWVVTADSDHNQGFSYASFNLSPTGHGLFSGCLSTQKSFQRETYLDWSQYTHLVLRVRGDGRSYMLNIGSPGYFDILWLDLYAYVLYTRGGPYWQTAKIPFSKFFLYSKGRTQDSQCPIDLTRVHTLGISVGDQIEEPFRLEIDYIGLYKNPTHTEKFAYEMYQTPRFVVGS